MAHSLILVSPALWREEHLQTSVCVCVCVCVRVCVCVGCAAFRTCTALITAIFRPRIPLALIAWASSSRNRTNWQLTAVKQSRNVLRLITALALERRDVSSVDPDGQMEVFKGCLGLDGIVVIS